jgi:DegV family protein with EDD domain
LEVKIVTDSGTNVCLTSEELNELGIHIVPLRVTLGDKTYREGVDIETAEFYRLLALSNGFPSTSQPSVGDFVEIYQRLAATDPDILSIHMSSGLSGTINSARAAAKLVPEANILCIDTKTLTVAAGWQVEAAARAIKAGWGKDRALALVAQISTAAESLYTLKDLKYLIHGGRISHLKSLVASVLDIKPLIGVEKVNGTYIQRGQARTFQRSLEGIVGLMARHHALHSALRVQVLHSFNPEGADILRHLIDEKFDCTWLPVSYLSLVLGAHVGPSMVAVAYAPLETFAGIVEMTSGCHY